LGGDVIKGWHNESARHAMAARGMRTVVDRSYIEKNPIFDILENKNELIEKLDHYISLVDGRHEIENGDKAIRVYQEIFNDIGFEFTFDELKELFGSGYKLFDVTGVSVVGSRVRGGYRPESDIDVLVTLKFTDEAIRILRLKDRDPFDYDWGVYVSEVSEGMVNRNFTVRQKTGEPVDIDVHIEIEAVVREEM